MSENKRATTEPSVEEDPNAAVACSSPPCFMHELDPAYLGYLSREEISTLLRPLLAAGWGGAVPNEARLRAALRRHLEAQGDPMRDRPAASGGLAGPGEPPDDGLQRLARAIRDAMPRIHDDALRRDLQTVLDALEHANSPRKSPAGEG
jgi:hypothetical protein